MLFLPPDDEHMCSKHVEEWNKLIVKQKFCASIWFVTEIYTVIMVTRQVITCFFQKNSGLPTDWYLKGFCAQGLSFAVNINTSERQPFRILCIQPQNPVFCSPTPMCQSLKGSIRTLFCINMVCTMSHIRFNLSNQLYIHYNANTIEKQEKLVRHIEIFIVVENST